MKKLGICTGLIGFALATLVGSSYGAAAGGKTIVHSDTLTGYQETPAISSAATGSFSARIDELAGTIDYVLSYSGLEGGATLAAHIHFGFRHLAGGVSAFLCGGGSKPACPNVSATVTGTITAADIIGPAGQGITAGQIEELIRAIRAGVTYINVHTVLFPSGEIRGQVNDDNQRQP